jgi:hypothetical protein
MKGDFSRLTFHRRHRYSSVRLQQGRVQLDSDWNEQIELALHRERTTNVDVVGRTGAPYDDGGFAVSPVDGDLAIGYGRMYVDGILCENVSRGLRYTTQQDFPGAALPTTDGRYFALLDVWELHVTAVEQPELREVALGGPDSATRTRVVWQVRLAPAPPSTTSCAGFQPPPGSGGTLRARADPAPPPADECDVPPAGGYRGLENQLYRIEVDDPAGPVFKWSRDNGSVLARLESVDSANSAVTVSDSGKDAVLAFAAGQWVEIVDQARVLLDEPGYLVQLADPTGTTLKLQTFPAALAADFAADPTGGWTVRRWDGTGTGVPGTWQDLESGVQVEFKGADYLRGDFWTIPARTITGAVEWPLDQVGDPDYRPPAGIRHHYAPLALVDLATGAAGATWTVVHDCRRLFPPLTDATAFYYVGGDGQETMPHAATLILPEPLEVGVANGEHPVGGATVHFELGPGPGAATLLDVDADGHVVTGADGIASCRWQLDPGLTTQRVTATLLDEAGNTVQTPIHFTAGLSVAAEVSYDPGTCKALAGADTVQAAIGALAGTASIAFAGGDGQEGESGEDLPSAIAVGVESDCGPLVKGSGATVRFSAEAGNGTLRETDAGLLVNRTPDGLTLEVTTDAEGIAAAVWTLEPAGSAAQAQHARAVLLDAGGAPTGLPIAFNAQLAGGATADPGIHVKAIAFRQGGQLENDMNVSPTELLSGIEIVCDGPVDDVSVAGKPTVFVTLDLPYPVTNPDIDGWGNPGMLGTQPLVLSADVNAEENVIIWQPRKAVIGPWIVKTLFEAIARYHLAEVICHLTLEGNFIWSPPNAAAKGPLLYLDGDAFGVPLNSQAGAPQTGLLLPSGDRRAGGDFELWFRLTGG